MKPEYFTHSGLQLFRCEPYRLTIRPETCAKNWRSVKGKKIGVITRLHHCVGCPIGAYHAGEKIPDKPVEQICVRCHRKSARYVGGIVCVSCYNRQREFERGKNARGNPPIHLRKIVPVTLQYGAGDQLSTFRGKAAETDELLNLEAMLRVTYESKQEVQFGFHRPKLNPYKPIPKNL